MEVKDLAQGVLDDLFRVVFDALSFFISKEPEKFDLVAFRASVSLIHRPGVVTCVLGDSGLDLVFLIEVFAVEESGRDIDSATLTVIFGGCLFSCLAGSICIRSQSCSGISR